jgi:hypothetical protein
VRPPESRGKSTVSRSARFCARLKLFNRLGSLFCNSTRLAGRQHIGPDSRPLEVQRPAPREVADRRFARMIDAEVRCSGRARFRPMKVIGLPSRISGRAFLDGEHCAFHVDAEDESERLFRGAQAARSRPAPDQPRRGGLSDLGGFVCDLSGPPAAVGVLDGGSLAGKDSSSSSSSFSSGFDCGLIGDDFRGSLIPASPWVPRALIGLKLQKP